MLLTSADSLSNFIRDYRKKNKLSQSVLADTIGLKQATVSSFETHSEGTKLQTLFKILAALNLELHIEPRESNKKEHDTGWDQEW